jgi:hypothetical protein
MAKNRFEQVDELQSDAINLTLLQKSDGQIGIIHCPKTAAPDQLPADLTSQEIPVRDAVVGGRARQPDPMVTRVYDPVHSSRS